MKRLTQWYDDGKIRGVLVKDGYEENALRTIVTKIDECYAAVALLKEYEDTGLTPPEIAELKERNTAKAPEEIQDAFGDGRLICPNCRNSVINYFNRSRPPQFCMICGQRLRWEEGR